MSVATTLVMFLTLFMVTTLIMLNLLADSALKVVQDKVDLSVYFVPEATTEEVNVVRTRLQSMSEVDTITYISKEDALRDFEERHQDNPLIQGALGELEANPLQPSLVVKARSPEDYAPLAEVLLDDEFDGVIESVNVEDNHAVVEKLTSTTNLLSKMAIWVTIVFSVIAVLIVFNTIRLAIYTQRDEISVMRLVGAQSAFIRMPLVLVGAMYGVLAALLSTLSMYPIVQYVGPRANAFLGEASLDINVYFLSNLWLILGAQLAFGVLLGIISSFIAIRRYMRKGEVV